MDPKYKIGEDEWVTTKREAYADNAKFDAHRLRKPVKQSSGGFLGTVSSLLIVAGIGWGVYLYVSAGGALALQNRGPVVVCGLGVVLWIVNKFRG